MRMWMIEPVRMCTQHLLGEHREIHMLVGSIRKGRNIKGFLENQLLEPLSIKSRHDAIVKEMHRRGYRHNTPVDTQPDTGYLGVLEASRVDPEKSRKDLAARCAKCNELLKIDFV